MHYFLYNHELHNYIKFACYKKGVVGGGRGGGEGVDFCIETSFSL